MNTRSQRFMRATVFVLLVVCFVLGCVWRITDWHDRYGVETLTQWVRLIQDHPATPILIIVIYIIGGLLFFVHAALLWATVFTFDLWHAFVYCQLGSLASALAVYGLGRVLRRDVITKMAGSYMEEVSHALAHKGTLSLIVFHVFPICPFSMLNLLAGATHIRLRDFIAGTVLGMTPGILLLCFFGGRLLQIIQHPHWIDVLSFILFVLVGVWAFWALHKRVIKLIEE